MQRIIPSDTQNKSRQFLVEFFADKEIQVYCNIHSHRQAFVASNSDGKQVIVFSTINVKRPFRSFRNVG